MRGRVKGEGGEGRGEMRGMVKGEGGRGEGRGEKVKGERGRGEGREGGGGERGGERR